MKKTSLSLLASAMTLFSAQAALAQNNGAAPAADEGSDGLGDIVVTAQRRTENLQKVAAAATALSGDALDDRGITSVSGLESAAPAVSITDAGITQAINIRGIGLASNSPNVTAGVATYVDGLFQPPIVQANSFFDLAGVEVFRGPQGTFVGSNSTGGAIFINSRNPSTDGLAGYGTVEYGNFNHASVEGALNLPASDELAVRAAGLYRSRDSFYHDVGPFANSAGRLEESAGRLGIKWNPGTFQALLKLQLNDRRTGGYAYRPIQGTQFGAFRVGDIYTLSFDAPTAIRETAFISSLELRNEFASGIVLRSLSGYQNKSIRGLIDDDASQAPFLIPNGMNPPTIVGGDISSDYYAREKQYSQEINLISPTGGDLSWVVGGYFQRNDIVVRIFQAQAGFPTDIRPINRRTTTGVFAQGNYTLRPNLELQVGARWSHYKATGTGDVRIGNGIPGFPSGGLPVADLSGSHTDARMTGKVALNWTVNDDNLVYAFVARGYKPGGFNSTTSEFRPETVWNYEIGWKASLLDRRLRTQIDAFYYKYRDFQFEILEPSTGFTGVDNISNGSIKGIEAQLQAKFGGLTIDGSVAYVQSNLDGLTFVDQRQIPLGQLGPQCPVGAPSNPPVCFDYGPATITTTGGPNLYSPKWTYNFSVAYELPLSDTVSLTPRVNFSHVGARYTYLGYSPVSDRIDAYDLLSASLKLAVGRTTVEVFGTNLAKERYVAGQFGLNEFYGAPRQYGIRLGMEF